MNDGHSDKLVSDTYRELATEKPPAALNATIMKLARHDREQETGWYPAWMRPAAWAATIGLCLAIVLDITQIPDGTSPEPVSTTQQNIAVEDAFVPSESNLVADAREIAELRAGPNQDAFVLRESNLAQQLTAASVVQELAAKRACEELQRENAERWYRCISDLRKSGRTEDAEQEWAMLIESFPGFEPDK